ncbi:hypothetical protein INQ45_01550 [Flavobacterium columnare]|uniref:hypothetical protein n=1 Tax=Flavobacterium columnare TaxID=996 RepID=UPI002D205A6D|nr:hypothetical protein [Flavobacterium columnare]MEB3799812.1 hypothetical protein [Flavobacterium columnare]
MEDFNEAMGQLPESVDPPKSQESFERAEFQKKEFILDLETAKISRFIANTTLRKQMSYWASFVVTAWLSFVGYIIMYNNDKFCLSDSVLNTLITTTTINVIGIILICFRDLFNGKSEITIK